jgi:hypothetical protein
MTLVLAATAEAARIVAVVGRWSKIVGPSSTTPLVYSQSETARVTGTFEDFTDAVVGRSFERQLKHTISELSPASSRPSQ